MCGYPPSLARRQDNRNRHFGGIFWFFGRRTNEENFDIFLMTIFILTGCINTNEIDSEIDFTGFKLSYLTDTSKYTKKYCISIDYSEEYSSLELLDYDSDTVTEFYISDRSNLDAYIDKLRNDPELFKFDYKLGDTKSNIWYLQIDTPKRSYCNGGMKVYPEFWDEFWDVLIDTTEAESKQDFGFIYIDDELRVNQKEYVERTESFWMRLDYPEFAGDETYVNVNDIILNAILDLPVFDMNNYSDLGVVNFYDGISCIYLIVDGIVGSDYGIMKIMK